MGAPAAILMYGRDPYLTYSRCLVLEKSGYKVLTTMSFAGIGEMSSHHHVDLLMLCHTLSMEECGQALVSAYSWHPRIKCLVMLAGDSGCHSMQNQDQVFDAMDGPAKLIATVGRMV